MMQSPNKKPTMTTVKSPSVRFAGKVISLAVDAPNPNSTAGLLPKTFVRYFGVFAVAVAAIPFFASTHAVPFTMLELSAWGVSVVASHQRIKPEKESGVIESV